MINRNDVTSIHEIIDELSLVKFTHLFAKTFLMMASTPKLDNSREKAHPWHSQCMRILKFSDS